MGVAAAAAAVMVVVVVVVVVFVIVFVVVVVLVLVLVLVLVVLVGPQNPNQFYKVPFYCGWLLLNEVLLVLIVIWFSKLVRPHHTQGLKCMFWNMNCLQPHRLF